MRKFTPEEQIKANELKRRMMAHDPTVTDEERDWLASSIIPDIPPRDYIPLFMAVGAWILQVKSHSVEARCCHEIVLFDAINDFSKAVRRHSTGREMDSLLEAAAFACMQAETDNPDDNDAPNMGPLAESLAAAMEGAAEAIRKAAAQDKPEEPNPEEVRIAESVEALFNRPLAPEEGEEGG